MSSKIELPPMMEPRPERGTVARAYCPMGSYWRRSIIRPDAAYVNEGDLIWTGTTFDDSWKVAHDYYSEVDLLKLDEVRLVAALTLPLSWDAGIVAFHPMPDEVLIPDNLDLTSVQARSRISKELRRTSRREYDYQGCVRFPRALGGTHEYEIRDSDPPVHLQERMLDAIDTSDHLLIRGLNSLLRFCMLWQYGMFFEEATHALYVGLDAAYSLVEREMIADGYKNPSSYDRMAWLESKMNHKLSGMRFFEEFQDDRIRTVHAESRLGIFPFAPLSVDDGCFLYYALREFYNFLIFGQVVERPVA